MARPAAAAALPSTAVVQPVSPAASGDYRIGPSDLLAISVLQAPELKSSVRVSEQGQVSLPLLGMVPVAGLTAQELETQLESRLREKYIRDPDVTVEVTDVQSRAVSVVGSVRRPGTVQVPGHTTLLELISLAGGLADDAGDTATVWRHAAAGAQPGSTEAVPSPASAGAPPAPVPIVVSVKALLESKEPGVDIPIYPGDVVNVQAAALVYVVGAVKKPGAFSVRGNDRLTVLRALALGEGLLPIAAGGDAVVVRTAASGERTQIPVDLGDVLKGKHDDVVLQAQDVLFVPTSGGKVAAKGTLDALTRMITLHGLVP